MVAGPSTSVSLVVLFAGNTQEWFKSTDSDAPGGLRQGEGQDPLFTQLGDLAPVRQDSDTRLGGLPEGGLDDAAVQVAHRKLNLEGLVQGCVFRRRLSVEVFASVDGQRHPRYSGCQAQAGGWPELLKLHFDAAVGEFAYREPAFESGTTRIDGCGLLQPQHVVASIAQVPDGVRRVHPIAHEQADTVLVTVIKAPASPCPVESPRANKI